MHNSLSSARKTNTLDKCSADGGWSEETELPTFEVLSWYGGIFPMSAKIYSECKQQALWIINGIPTTISISLSCAAVFSLNYTLCLCAYVSFCWRVYCMRNYALKFKVRRVRNSSHTKAFIRRSTTRPRCSLKFCKTRWLNSKRLEEFDGCNWLGAKWHFSCQVRSTCLIKKSLYRSTKEVLKSSANFVRLMNLTLSFNVFNANFD